jgi:hypothetical protein
MGAEKKMTTSRNNELAKGGRNLVLVALAMGMTFLGTASGLEVSWGTPVANDGTPLTDLAGFRIHYGTNAGVYTTTIDVGMASETTLSDLSVGVTYHIVLTAYSTEGFESKPSGEIVYEVPADPGTRVEGDEDGDGMDDEWEAMYADGDLEPNVDLDGDGHVNLAEYVAGTDPMDASSVLRVKAVARAVTHQGEENVLVTWESVPGRTYTLLRSTNLTAGFEVVAAGIGATDVATTYEDAGLGGKAAFYSLSVSL